MSVSQILFDIAPEMESLDSGLVSRLISYSTVQVGFCKGVTRQLAIAYLTAHMYTLSARDGGASGGSGATGSVTSIKEGDLAKSFGGGGITGTAGEAALAQTSYGLEFLRLRRMCVLSVRTRQV